MLGPSSLTVMVCSQCPHATLWCAPSVRTRPADRSDCPLVVKHDGFTGSQRQYHAPEQTHSHPASGLVTDRTVGPNRVPAPRVWGRLGVPWHSLHQCVPRTSHRSRLMAQAQIIGGCL
jgi:hypothetical protein